jgi:hypothetical protein
MLGRVSIRPSSTAGRTYSRFRAESADHIHLVVDGIIEQPLRVVEERAPQVGRASGEVQGAHRMPKNVVLLVQRQVSRVIPAEVSAHQSASQGYHALYSIIPVHSLSGCEIHAILGLLDKERPAAILLSLPTALREEILPKVAMLWLFSERGETQNGEFQLRMTRVGVYLAIVWTDVADPRVDILNSGFSSGRSLSQTTHSDHHIQELA